MYGTTLSASAAMSPICMRKMAANGHAWRGTARAMSRTATLGLKLAASTSASSSSSSAASHSPSQDQASFEMSAQVTESKYAPNATIQKKME